MESKHSASDSYKERSQNECRFLSWKRVIMKRNLYAILYTIILVRISKCCSRYNKKSMIKRRDTHEYCAA
jgi:hypothetical protein